MKLVARRAASQVRYVVSIGILALGAQGATAGIPISEGNVQQKSCIGNRVDSLYKIGSVISGGTVLQVKDKRVNLGKPLAPGEVVYYVSLTDAKKVYQTDKQIEIVDSSPLTPDVAIAPNTDIVLAGTFISSTGKRFDLINVGSGFNHFFMPVNDAGFVCADRLEVNKLVAQGLPQVYQELPLRSAITEDPLAKSKVTSIAITYAGGSGATVSFEVVVMVNGNVEMKKVSSFDAFSSQANIGNLSISFKAENGQVAISSIDEPAEYLPWLTQLRKTMRR